MSYSELASPHATRAILEAYGHDPKYKLGQNFLVDDNVIGHILDLAGLLPGAGDTEASGGSRVHSPTVLEIGPGIGTLTVALLKSANVVAVERDSDLAPILAETTALDSDRFVLLHGDALKVRWDEVEDACARLGAPQPNMLVSNLPYQIAATVILDWFERFSRLQSMVVMVQSEVADRIQAKTRTKDYGAYTIKLRLHAKVTGRFQVPPSCFLPRPHVESAVIRLERDEASGDAALIARACELADAAFAQRRKNIRNSMSSKFDKRGVDGLLKAAGIDPTTRGETLAPADYLHLAELSQ